MPLGGFRINGLAKAISIVVGGYPQFPQIRIHPADNAVNDNFGRFSISISTSDNRIVIGANLDDTPVNAAGSAYVYDLQGNLIIKIIQSDANYAWNFGRLVAVGEGIIVISSGARPQVYIYDLNGVFIAELNPNSNQFRSLASIKIGYEKILLGYTKSGVNNAGLSNHGQLYVYSLSGNIITTRMVNSGSTRSTDAFGKSCSIGPTRIVVGASGENYQRVYIYDSNLSLITSIGTPITSETSRDFGSAVAVSDSRIVVGASISDGTSTFSGRAFLYDLDGNLISELVDIENTSRAGTNVGIQENLVFVTSTNFISVFDIDGNYLMKYNSPDNPGYGSYGGGFDVGDDRWASSTILSEDGSYGSYGTENVWVNPLPIV